MNFALSFVVSFVGSSHTFRKGAGDARASYWPDSFESSVVNTAVVNHWHPFTLNHAAHNGGCIYSQITNHDQVYKNSIHANAVSTPTCRPAVAAHQYSTTAVPLKPLVLMFRLCSSRTTRCCVFPGQNCCTTVLTALFAAIKHERPFRRT